jgi:hypothetical protein
MAVVMMPAHLVHVARQVRARELRLEEINRNLLQRLVMCGNNGTSRKAD